MAGTTFYNNNLSAKKMFYNNNIVKKAFMDNKQCFSGLPDLVPFSTRRYSIASFSLKNESGTRYAVFVGGRTTEFGDTIYPIEIYSDELVHSTWELSTLTYSLLASSPAMAYVGKYGLCAGGEQRKNGTSTIIADVRALYVSDYTSYGIDFSHPTDLATARESLTGSQNNNYAFFAGGRNSNGSMVTKVDSYNASLTRGAPSALSTALSCISGASTGNGKYALFAGGVNSSIKSVATVTAYNESGTKSTPTALSHIKQSSTGVTLGDNVLFIGGFEAKVDTVNTIDVYNNSLTRTVLSLTSNRYDSSAVTFGDYAIVAGCSEDVEIYDKSLTRRIITVPGSRTFGNNSYGKYGAVVNNYALFMGQAEMGFTKEFERIGSL